MHFFVVRELDILCFGEKTGERKYINGTKFKYCFDDYENCGRKFAIEGCMKIRKDHNCLKQLNACKFREKSTRCCLMYKCVQDNDKEKENDKNKITRDSIDVSDIKEETTPKKSLEAGGDTNIEGLNNNEERENDNLENHFSTKISQKERRQKYNDYMHTHTHLHSQAKSDLKDDTMKKEN